MPLPLFCRRAAPSRQTAHAGFAALALAAVVGLSPTAHAQSFGARVVGVVDGDTIDVLDAARTQTRCRLGNIDAPERRQAFGHASRKHLAGLVFDKHVQVVVSDKDRYGRSICQITLGGHDVSASQVAAGMAWVYPAYNRDRSLPGVEDRARRAGAGLWADADATPPWEWRRQKRTTSAR